MGGIDAEKIAQEAINAIADKIKNLHTLNIIVAGKTGVGKSTLINAVFKDKLAETGMGKPVTTHMRKITKKGVPLAIFDTRGFELGKEVQAEVKKRLSIPLAKDWRRRISTKRSTAFGTASIRHLTESSLKKSSGSESCLWTIRLPRCLS